MTKRAKFGTSLKPVKFEGACEIWARADHWPLVDAVNLALGYHPELVRTKPLTAQERRRRDVIVELAKNCVGESLIVMNTDAANGELRVRPHEFLQWFATRTQLPIPDALSAAMGDAATHFRPVDAMHELSIKQRRRERCRAIAAILWAQNPSLTKAQVAESAEIQTHGLLGGQYTSETIQEWIKEENPNRQGGRPRRNP